jgi:tryptophan synthase alpha chain
MSLEQYIRERLTQRPLLLMTHTVVGYPSLDDNWRMLERMDAAGVDLVELQMPFSEPIADGPLFIRANQAALSAHLHRDDYFRFMEKAAAAFRFRLLFMGYYNSIFRIGHEAFCERLRRAGAAGFIVADLPPEEAGDLDRLAAQRGLDDIRLMTPVNPDARLREIAARASGFIYCVARKGVTGRATELDAGIRDYMRRCRAATSLPLGLGFGIRGADDVAQLHGVADIAIVGSACLETWEQDGAGGFTRFLDALMAATRT